MSCLLHLSDPHFGTEQGEVVDALLGLADALAPELVVLSGDITQRATPAQFDAAKQFCARLPQASSLLVTPGNHDIPLFDLYARSCKPYARFEHAFPAGPAPCYAGPGFHVVGVKTTRRWRHTHGQIDRAQWEGVTRFFKLHDTRPRAMRIVVTHQPVHVPEPGERHNRLRGAAPALVYWSHHGVDAVLGGHIHLPYVVPLHAPVPGLCAPLYAIQAGTAVSNRTRAGQPNSVNVIRYDRTCDVRQASVERWDYQALARRFERVQTHALGLAA